VNSSKTIGAGSVRTERIIAFETTTGISTIITHDAFSNASVSGSGTVASLSRLNKNIVDANALFAAESDRPAEHGANNVSNSWIHSPSTSTSPLRT